MKSECRVIVSLGFLLGALAGEAQAQTELSAGDRDFITKAAQGGQAEVAMGKEAAESKAADISAFGKQMIADHTKMNDELAAIAKQKGVAPPDSPSMADSAKGAAMNVMPGKMFDSQYISSQIKDHQATLELLKTEAGSGRDAGSQIFCRKGHTNSSGAPERAAEASG